MGSEDGTRRSAASTSDGVASPVAIWENELIGEPQEEQKRESSRTSTEHEGHFIAGSLEGCYFNRPRRLVSESALSRGRGGKTAGTEQLDLFGAMVSAPGRRDAIDSERLAHEHAEAGAIAARLPKGVFFGTSTWSFPGWAGIVYSHRAMTAELARDGLLEYVRHPLLTTVGIDRGYYSPIPVKDLERYAAQLPPGFPCCAKAPEAVTAVRTGDRRRNPDYLRPGRFVEEMVGPFLEVFSEHTGPFVIQFPPAPREATPEPALFADTLARFLEALPREARYAVELRDPGLLSTAYRDVLAARGVAHVYNYVTAMPMPAEQARAVPLETASFAMIRLLLRPGTRYEERREEFLPFDRIVDPNEAMRRQVVALIREAVAAGREAYVLVNNKAEGCSPLTIRALAELLAREEAGA
jgi:uncharacterized protein YecE (DUF72 family)